MGSMPDAIRNPAAQATLAMQVQTLQQLEIAHYNSQFSLKTRVKSAIEHDNAVHKAVVQQIKEYLKHENICLEESSFHDVTKICHVRWQHYKKPLKQLKNVK
jgi:hypothetical protein